MKIIIPCCDHILYDGIPRIFVNDNLGNKMIDTIINSLKINHQDIIIVLYQQNNQKYNLNLQYPNIKFLFMNQLQNGQPATIINVINYFNINEPIFIKDCDSSFTCDFTETQSNFICADSLNNFTKINTNSKSYIQKDHNDFVLNIKEKLIISDLFSTGGYFFNNVDHFITIYNKLTKNMTEWQNNIYMSDIIGRMILEDEKFKIQMVNDYKDYGTLTDWNENK